MPTKVMWMVRAGEGAIAIEDFRTRNVVAIGWERGGDWTRYKDRDAIQARIAELDPENTETQNLVAARQIVRFTQEFKVGDRVISYDPSTRMYLVGAIKSAAAHKPGLIAGLATVRDVAWEGEVPRD